MLLFYAQEEEEMTEVQKNIIPESLIFYLLALEKL